MINQYEPAVKYKKLYKTKRWRNSSKNFRLAHPICVFCGAPGEVVDHIIPHKGNRALFFDPRNWQTLCKRCHDSAKYRMELGQVPGKDFVIDNKSDDDGLPTSSNHPWNKE